ncbi:MAG: bifunctional folylpolyglutamate synthase/dihydrofolate synthase [Armatimonadetes bacterium]|nr:bifunctional folylpolyglutamate synthase/dihydrofolate synthase [Armatimonadota bacterium]MDW8120890.1 folylpolyglutamate synthase/dihydrofolate synthase family protein [Armatimonadota bacterium]
MDKGTLFLKKLERFGIKPGLERIEALLQLAGEPHQTFPSVLIGGTNGKGSTAAFLTAILSHAGYKVATYTSPHLVRERERIQVNQQPISAEQWAEHLQWAEQAVEQVSAATSCGAPTQFEVLTAVAFRYFAQEKVDIAVVEVGLGGRWDATNILEPAVSIITSIALDHTDRLGPDPFTIAKDKLGIARPRRPLVTAERRPSVLNLFYETAALLPCPLVRVGKDINWSLHQMEETASEVTFQTKTDRYRVRLGLAGGHQLPNFGCALAAAEALSERGWTIPKEAILAGAATARCPGRLQLIDLSPFGKESRLLLDGAHNPAGAAVLARSLASLFRFRRLFLIVGFLKDKNASAFLSRLAPLADVIYCVEPPSPRALPLFELVLLASQFGNTVKGVPDPLQALYSALEESGPEDLICATGSLYVIGTLLNETLDAIRDFRQESPANVSSPSSRPLN